MRTDSHNNPTAFITDLARQGGLREGLDFTIGDSFRYSPNSPLLYTARLIGDPIGLTIRVIDAVGFYNHSGAQRWSYIAMPEPVWKTMSPAMKAAVIGGMYHREGGTELKKLFPTQFIF